VRIFFIPLQNSAN